MARRFTHSLIVIISFLLFQQELFAQTAAAGPDQIRCTGNTATMAGNKPTGNNKGLWTYVSGTTGTFATNNDTLPNVVFTAGTATPTGTTTLRWTIWPGLVISQVYGGGNLTGATFRNDFVELHNRSTRTINLVGYSIQYGSSTGNYGATTAQSISLTGTIAPGAFRLIQLSGGTTNGVALPTADQTGTIDMASTAGKVALVKSTTLLNCGGGTTCTATQIGTIVDIVAYGTSTGLLEGTPTAALSSTTTARRNPVGTACTDTNSNSSDFTVGAASVGNVRNAASVVQACTALSSDDMTITWSAFTATNTVAETSGTANDGIVACGSSAMITAATTASSPTYLWSANAGSATTATINVTPTVTTTYTCTVTITGGCTATTSRTITVNGITATNTVAETSGTANDGIVACGAPATITASTTASSPTYLWSANAGSATTAAINVIPTVTTTYTCTVTVAGGCTATTSRTVTVTPITVSNTVAETSSIANDGIVACGDPATITAATTASSPTYLWSANAGSVTTATINVTPSVTTTYTCTVTAAGGCTATTSRTITVTAFNPAQNTITESAGVPNNGTICAGLSAMITAPTGASYIWSANAGAVTTASVTVSPTITTTYTVTVTNAVGCTAVRSSTITIGANDLGVTLITLTENSGIVNDGLVCQGSSATITAASASPTVFGYSWSSAPAGFTGTGATINPTVTVTSTYTVTVTNNAGCTATEQQLVTTSPIAAVCKDITISLTDTVVTVKPLDVANMTLTIGTPMSVVPNAFKCVNIGTNPVVLTVGNLGCETTCTANVVVTDGLGCNPTVNPKAPKGPSITDPCACQGTPTNLKDGQFSDKVEVLNAFANQVWAIKNVSGYNKRDAAAAAGAQHAIVPFAVGDLLTSVPLAGGRANFELAGFHIDSVGYTIEVWRLDNAGVGIPGSELNTSNRCYYPTPVYHPVLPLIVKSTTAPIILSINDINEGTLSPTAIVTHTGTGVSTGVFNPTTAGLGAHTITSKLDYGQPTAMRTGQNIAAPVCASTVKHQITVDNTVMPALICRSAVNYTLTRDCYADVLAGEFLLGAPVGFGGYMATIMDNGVALPTSSIRVGGANVGKTYTVKISDGINSCWSTLKVEDKTPPAIECGLRKIFYCEDNVKLNLDKPLVATPANAGVFSHAVVTECSSVTLTYIDQGSVGICADATTFAGNRIYAAVDAAGNVASCAVPFEIRKRNLADIVFPSDRIINCSDLKGTTVDTAQGGQPTINGKKLNVASNCKISATYTDVRSANACGIGFTIIREWIATSSCELTPRIYKQTIAVKDTIAPIITEFSNDVISIGINTDDCRANGTPLPLPTVKDNCDVNPTITAQIVRGSTIYSNGTIAWNLAPGTYIVLYKVSDKCANERTTTRTLVVEDKNPPQAQCRVDTRISLARMDNNEISALSIDAGSKDNCCLDINRYEIKRMSDPDAAFAPTLKLNCLDKDINVILRVWDCYNNANTCMTNVVVSDKLAPIAIPENIAVNCGNDASAKVWLDNNQLKELPQMPGAGVFGYFDHLTNSAACKPTAKISKVIDSLDNCGKGFYAHEWTVTDAAGNSTVVTQRYVSNNVSSYEVTFPKDTIILLNTECDTVGTGLDVAGRATYNVLNGSCPNISLSYYDQATKVSEDSICFSITRVWRVANLCNEGTLGDPTIVNKLQGKNVKVTSNDSNKGFFEYRQLISVIDRTPPSIEKLADAELITTKDCNITLTLNEPEAKDCSGQRLFYSFVLSKADGTVVTTPSNDLPATIQIAKADFGDYRVVYKVTDACGNASVATQNIKVKDNMKPTPVCHDNIAAELMPNGTVMVMASSINAGSFDNCTDTKNLIYKIRVLTDSTIIKNDTVQVDPTKLTDMHTFICPPKGTPTGISTKWTVQLWVGDEAGNWDYCQTIVDLQDNNQVCNYDPNEMRPVDVEVKNEKGKVIEGVNVKLEGTKFANVISSKVGKVRFNDLPTNGNYIITPELASVNSNPLNGVSTFDLVLMSRHVLGLQPFNTPYQYIAADVNRSGTVTTADVVELRKMILALQAGFTKNNAWRFVDASYIFPNTAPLSIAYPERVSMNGVANNAAVSFIGVKIGDVNVSASARPFASDNGGRSANITFFATDEKEYREGDIVTTTFASEDALYGYQFTFDYDKKVLELVDIQDQKEGFGILENGILTASQIINDDKAASFSLTFKAKTNGKLSESMRINSRLLSAEAYDKSGAVNGVALKFNNAATAKFELFQNQPNPFNGNTMISFNLPVAGNARLVISDVSGKVLKTISGDFAKGYNQVIVEKSELGTSGVIYYRLETATQNATKKMIIVE